MAVVNVGVRPTFGGTRRSVEAHIIDFEGELYGRMLELTLVARLRDERRFDGIKALIAQIRTDVEHTRALLRGEPEANNLTEV